MKEDAQLIMLWLDGKGAEVLKSALDLELDVYMSQKKDNNISNNPHNNNNNNNNATTNNNTAPPNVVNANANSAVTATQNTKPPAKQPPTEAKK